MVQRVINLISVIVPVYNVENYLQSCIKSLLNQSYKKLEIVLVDDGSTDSSGIICDSFRKKYKNIQVIHKKMVVWRLLEMLGLNMRKVI